MILEIYIKKVENISPKRLQNGDQMEPRMLPETSPNRLYLEPVPPGAPRRRKSSQNAPPELPKWRPNGAIRFPRVLENC